MTTKRELYICHQYLNFPVKNGAAMRKVRIRVGDQVVRLFDIEWAEGDVDFWAFTDISEFKDEQLIVEIVETEKKAPLDNIRPSTSNSENLLAIIHSDKVEGAEDLYKEKCRPQFHFTSRRGWINDPNGLVFYKGVYHLFYQHNPYGRQWGNMHWGHATSKNLVQWEELSDVLYPDEMGTMFSGSGLVDWQNSSDLKRGPNEPLICLYTAAGEYADPKVPFTQCLMFSHDGAQSWHKYENNPVLPPVASGSRDPAVIWNPEFQQWMMVLYIGKNKERENNNQHFALFRSKNLKEWERIQDLFFPGTGECGECFPIALDEDVEQIRWVFWTADGYYLIGKFDGNKFIPETEILKSTYSAVRCEKSIGLNFRGGYAAQTWNDIPPEDGRRIQIAWLADDIPDMPFNQQMTFPVELTLLSTESGLRLRSWPVKEIELLYQQKRVIQNIELSDTPTILPTDEHDLLDILVEIEVEDKSEFELNLRGISLIYDAEKQKLSCLDRTTCLKPVAGKIKLRVLLDRASVEIYAADGLVYIPISVVPNESEKSCFVYFPRGKGAVKELHIFKLNSSWAN
ncbi:MAG: glycoside hydrolase family 32 protein [Planktomarina sp.]|nr:glycoside hydrolase family 32 protein [Planktomarina sp.]